MMLNEFVKLTGFQPTEEYYHSVIEPLYELSDLDKQEWCDKWRDDGGIQKAYDNLVESLGKTETEIKIHKEVEKREAYWFIDMADKYSAAELRLRAIDILGPKPYLKYKLEKQLRLWDEDLKLLINELDHERD